MRFSTLIPLLLAAGLVSAQQGNRNGQNGQGQNGQNGQGQNGQNGQGQNGQNGQGQNGQNGQGQNGQNGQNGQGNGQNGQGQNNNNNALALNPANVQTASQSDGFDDGQEEGQAASAT